MYKLFFAAATVLSALHFSSEALAYSEIVADGTAKVVDLSGENGRDGAHGSMGGGLSCPGNGEDGQNGADGDDALIYAQDLSLLSRIRLLQSGGRGGKGGFPGSGGIIDSDVMCIIPTHGNEGKNGSYGTVYLVPRLEKIEKSKPSVEVSLPSLAQNPVALSSHVWQSRTGLRKLLASGSDVRDAYFLWNGTRHYTYSMDWQASRPVSEFKDRKVTIEVNSDGKLVASFDSDLWVSARAQQNGTNATLTVAEVLHSNDATDLKIVGVEGSGADLTLLVRDMKNVSKSLKTEFTAEILSKNLIGTTQRYRGPVAANLVSLSGDLFRLKLGKLPVDAKHLEKGRKLVLTFWAKRSLGEQFIWVSKKQEFKL